eukprot:GHVL01024947.1.p1 GENE.GHVL01024947.1~~GHVL01024947.1.p1  ORF type:complete len:659 (-),score=179.63 GHVL01024947.1:69-2045(-)
MLGPQEERIGLHTTSIRRPIPPPDPVIHGKGQCTDELLDQVARLKQENDDLRDFGDRTTKELRYIRSKLPSSVINREDSLTTFHDDDPLPPWTTNVQLMAPLFLAYDDRINELEMQLKLRQRQLENFENTYEQLTKENEEYLSELRVKTEQIQKLYEAKRDAVGGIVDKSDIHAFEEREELSELYRLANEEVSVLSQQNHVLKQQLEACNEALQQTSSSTGEEINSLRIIIKSLEDKNKELDDNLEAAMKNAADYEYQLDQSFKEKEKLEASCQLTSSELKKINEDNRKHIVRLQEDNQTLIRNIEDGHRKQISNIREQSGPMLQSMEKKLQKITEQYEESVKDVYKAEQKIETLQREIDRVNASERTAKCQISDMENEHHQHIDKLRSDYTRMKCETEENCMKEINILKDRIEHLETSKISLESELEIRQRRIMTAESESCREISNMTAEISRHKRSADDAMTRLKECQNDNESLTSEVHTIKRHLADKVKSVEQLRNSNRNETQTLSGELENIRSINNKLEESLHISQEQIISLTRQRDDIKDQLNNNSKRYRDDIDEEKQKNQQKIALAEHQLTDAISRNKREEEKAKELLRAQSELQNRWKVELEKERSANEKVVSKIRQELKQQRNTNQQLLRILSSHSIDPGSLAYSIRDNM